MGRNTLNRPVKTLKGYRAYLHCIEHPVEDAFLMAVIATGIFLTASWATVEKDDRGLFDVVLVGIGAGGMYVMAASGGGARNLHERCETNGFLKEIASLQMSVSLETTGMLMDILQKPK